MEYTWFQDFARKIPRWAPPTGRPGLAQSGRHQNLATGPYKISMNIADGDWAIAKLSTPKERITCWSKEPREVNENYWLGGQFFIFLLKNPGK